MQSEIAWQEFLNTGSVFDYLSYCKIIKKGEQEQNEVYNRRTNNKREQCR